MNNELCKKCIDSEHSDIPINNVCEVCKRIDNLGNGENYEFIAKQQRPLSCGQCNYKRKSAFTDTYYCEAARHFDLADRRIAMPSIRKNYLHKNTPVWCPFPKEVKD